MSNMKNSSLAKLTAMLLVLAMFAGFLPTSNGSLLIKPLSAAAAEITLDLADPTTNAGYFVATTEAHRIVIKATDSGKTIRITDSGSTTRFYPPQGNNHGITIEKGFKGTVILDGIDIKTRSIGNQGAALADTSAAMMVYGSKDNADISTDILIRLEGANTLYSGYHVTRGNTSAAALEVERGSRITIEGSGSLHAQSSTFRDGVDGSSNPNWNGSAAGIGAGNRTASFTGGHIVIRGGTVKAYSGFHGAGIGGGWYQASGKWNGTILIYGGDVESHGGVHGAGIGGGCQPITGADGGNVVVLPPAKIKTVTQGSKPKLGNTAVTPIYVGDMGAGNSPATEYARDHFLVKLDPAPTTPVEIYMDLSKNTLLKNTVNNIIGNIVDPLYTIIPSQVYLGTTGNQTWEGQTFTFGNDELYIAGFFDASASAPITFRVKGATADGFNYSDFKLEDMRLSGKVSYPASGNYLPPRASNLGWPYTTGGATTVLNGNLGMERVINITAPNIKLLMEEVTPNGGEIYTGYDDAESAVASIKALVKHDLAAAIPSSSSAKTLKVIASGTIDKFDFTKMVVTYKGIAVPMPLPPVADPLTVPISWDATANAVVVTEFLTTEELKVEIPLKTGQIEGKYGLVLLTTADGIATSALPEEIPGEVKVLKGLVYPTIEEKDAANTPFYLTIDFNRKDPAQSGEEVGVADLTPAHFNVSKATISSVVGVGVANPAGYFTQWKLGITPAAGLESGDVMSITLPKDKVKDNRGEFNQVSNTVYVDYNTTGPIIDYSGVKPLYNKLVTAIPVAITTNGATGADRHMITIGGTQITANGDITAAIQNALVLTDASGVKLTSNNPTYNLIYDAINAKAAIVITPNPPLPEGSYRVAVASADIKNNNGVAIEVSNVPFAVALPALIDKPGDDGDITTGATVNRNGKIHAVPAVHSYVGGKSDLIVHGKNLKQEYLDAGQFKFYWTMDGTNVTISDYSQMVFAADGSSITFKDVVLPINSTNAHKSYAFNCELTDHTGTKITDTATVVVKSAATDWSSRGNGLTATPAQVGFAGGTASIKVQGINLHHYADLQVVVTNTQDPSYKHIIKVTPDIAGKHGDFEKVYSFVIPRNLQDSALDWNYKLFDGSTEITEAGSAKTIQDEAKPTISGDGFVIAANYSDAGTKTLTLPAVGGPVYFTVNGINLHNFKPMTVTNDGTLAVVADSTFDYSLDPDNKIVKTFASQGFAIPENRTRNDIVYIFTLNQNGVAGSHTVKVIVEKPSYGVETYEADIKEHLAPGGDTVFTLTGKYLDVINPLDLISTCGKITATITDISADGTSAKCKINFPAHQMGQLRNDEYFMEVVEDGETTGRIIKIEVGPSEPSVVYTYANPNYFNTVEALMASGGTATIEIEGNYMKNFSSVEIVNAVTGERYTVDNTDCDQTANHVVKVPSAKGVYIYEIWTNGAPSGLSAVVGVGVDVPNPTPGDPSGGLDDGSGQSTDHREKEEEYKGLGGGSKGGGFTGDKALAFDVLKYQSERAGKINPVKPVVNLLNTQVMTEQHFILAAEGVKLGSQAVTKVTGAPLEVIVHTSSPTNELVIEGQLYVTLNKPLRGMLTGVYTREDKVAKSRDMFKAEFDNENIWVVGLAHNGEYGTKVEIAALIEAIPVKNSSMKLYLYSFDRVTGEYKLLNDTEYFFDSAGYLHFNTAVGGDIIISDKALTKNGQVQNVGSLPPIQKPGEQEKLLAPKEEIDS